MNLDETFKLVAEKLNEYRIPWWLEYGSLLGVVREGKRIEWDDDYDIGYPLKYAPKVLKALLNINGVEICSNLYFQVLNKKERYHICLAPYISLNGEMYQVKENKIFMCINTGNFFIYPFLRSLPFYLQELLVKVNMKFYRIKAYRGKIKNYCRFIIMDMGGVPAPIPIGYDNILKDCYGDDYMTPNKDKSTCFRGNVSDKQWEKNNRNKIKRC